MMTTLNKMKVVLLLSGAMALTTSCGKQDQGSTSPAVLMDSNIIVGDLDWREITDLYSSHSIRRAGKAVADIKLPVMGSRCTGFLISENILMTNQHCIPSRSYARGVTASFKHEKGVSERNYETYECSTFIGNNERLDFALLKCAGNPGEKFGYVDLSSDTYQKNQSIYIVQQNCDYYSNRSCDWTKKFSEGVITRVSSEYVHNADTLGGSSGSPVFSKDSNEVIAIHHAGYGNNGRGRGYENYAVPMSKIVPYILTHFPEVDLGGGATGGDGNSSPDDNGRDNNETRSTATSLSKSFVMDQLISDDEDVDYYKFNITSYGYKTVKLSFSHRTGDLDLKLYRESGSLVARSDTTSSVEEVTRYLRPDTYYIKVYGYKGAKGKYKLSLK
jgi:V8-like Glu-specific endopeptidase